MAKHDDLDRHRRAPDDDTPRLGEVIPLFGEPPTPSAPPVEAEVEAPAEPEPVALAIDWRGLFLGGVALALVVLASVVAAVLPTYFP